MPTPPLAYGLPAPRTWYPGMPIKAPYLRSDEAQAIALLAAPPLFIGQQAQSSQTIPNSTDTPVSIDTELYDNAYGHLDTTNPTNYYDQLDGWYLCEAAGAIAYNGGAGATTVGIGYTPFGGSPMTWYGQRGPNSGTSGQRILAAVTKLIQMTTSGRPNADFVQLIMNQNSGSSEGTALTTSRFPWLQARWVALPSSLGTAPLPVPYNGGWPVGTFLTTQATSGATAVDIDDPSGLVPGGTIGLDTGTSIAETATIGAGYTIGSLAVPLTAALVNTHALGAPVAVPVSAAFLNKNVRDALNFLLYPPICEVYYQAGTATVPSTTALQNIGTAIPCDTKTVDNYSAYSTGTGIWTAPVAGTYYAYVQCHQSMNSTSQALAAGLIITSANYNGGAQFTWWGGTQQALAGSAAGNCAITRRVLRLAAGDTVIPAAAQNDSGSATTTLDYVGGSSVSESRLIMVWRGA
jgi:hypothetical protein